MRKGLLAVILLLLLGGAVDAEVQVLFLPDSGFLRVHGEVVMEPITSSPSFMLFPTAQITELWADELMEYTTERGAHGTMVSLSLREVRSQTLSFAYEGFLDLNGTELFLDRDSLWFPEFSFPIDGSQVNMELPSDWFVEWQSHPPLYPTLTVRDTRDVSIEEEIHNAPVVDEFASRLQMQMSRLINAINHRNATEIEALLSPALRETSLAGYLASLPLSHGQMTGELRDQFTIILSTERGFRYQASVIWQERFGRLELQSFQLKPHGPQIPEELLGSAREFVQALRETVQTENGEQLLMFLDPGIAQGQVEVLKFLLSLNARILWSVEYAVLDPFTITVFVPHAESTNTKLLLHMGLTPGEHHWLIHRLEVIPVG